MAPVTMDRPYSAQQTIGERVRAARQEYGMSQLELSRRAGISKTSMNNIEMGTVQDPHVSVLVGIARALRVSLDTLVGLDAGGPYVPAGPGQMVEPMW